MAVVKSCFRQISLRSSFIAVIATLVVGLFVSSAYADRVIYTNGDTIPNPVIGDAVSGDLEFNANTANIEFSGAVNDVSSSIPTNFFATGEKQVWLRGSNLFTGVSTVECNALAFKGNAANVTITSAGFVGSTKVAFESLNNGNAKNMALVLTADSSTPQPFTGTFQINSQSRLYFSSDANFSDATLKLNGGASNNFTEASFNMTSKTASFNSVTCDNQYVRFLNVNSSTAPADLNTISFKSGTFSGEMGRLDRASDLSSTRFVNYFNLTKASDGTENGGTLTLSGPVYYKGKTTIDGGTLVVSNSDFVSTSDLVGSGTLKLSGNNRSFNIASNTPSDFTGTIQIADSSISGNVRIKLAAATYSWSNNALQTTYSATDVNLPKATLLLDGNPSGKFAELAFNNKNSSLTVETLNGNTYGRILNLDSSITTATYNNLTVSNGNYAGEIGRSNDTSYPYVNHINFIKANDGSADGGTLTFSNKYILYDGTTTIEGGTLEITNSLSDNNYQYFARSTALKGSGNLNFTGSNWTVFDINAADTTTPQEFTGTVSVAENSKIMIKTENNAVKDLNLGNAALNLGKNANVGLHGNGGVASALTVKELNTETGSTVRVCSGSPSAGNFGVLTVGSGEINGNIGVEDNNYFNLVSLVKASDGTADGGTLTINGNLYYTGPTVIDGGTLCFENNGTGYKYFTASTALKGSGTLELQGSEWIGFSINADAAEPQEFTGTVNVKNKIMIRAADNKKNLNLGNGTLHLEENALVGLHVQGGEISALTVKELNTEPGSTVRLCSANPGANKFGTLTVGSGTVNGNLGETNDYNLWYNQVNLVKVSDGSDNGGTLTISGTNFYTGSIDIQEGTLKLADAATLSQGATTIGEAGVLEFNVANGEKQVNITNANPISGSGAIVKSGSGVLKVNNLDSPNTISAESFTVNAGELDFRGYFEGDIEIINGAVFSPGNSVGTLSVTGDVSIINGTALFEFGNYTGADENHDVLTILGADNLFTAGNGMISLAFDGDPNAWAADGGEYKLVSNEGFTVGDKSSWLSNYTDLFSLDGRSDGLYLVAGASPTPEPGSGVPEPSTWALLLLGAAGLMYVRKRKN